MPTNARLVNASLACRSPMGQPVAMPLLAPATAQIHAAAMVFCQPNFVLDMTECKLSEGVWDPADVCQSGVCVKAFAAEGDACSSRPLGNCDLPDTCHGKGAGVDRVMDVSIVRRPTDMEWDGSHACLADSFVIEGTGWGSDVDTVCNDPDTCKGMRVHPLYV